MKRSEFIFNILLLIISIILLCIYFLLLKGNNYEDELYGVIWAALAFSGGSLFNFIRVHWNDLTVAFKCYLTSVNNQDIYVSLSYLFRIKIDGQNKYLMVRGNKIDRQYQPVGGVYKRHASIIRLFYDWRAKEARNDSHNSDDLRFYVKGRFIPRVIRWFGTRKNREIDVWREFYEELVVTGILPEEYFGFIKPEYLYSKHERLIKRRGILTRQYLIFDIFSIAFTDQQKEALTGLLNKADFTQEYAFVDEEDLDKELIYNNGDEYQLGFHARYLINND